MDPKSNQHSVPPPTSLTFLAGGGEMGQRIQMLDWSKTPLGPAESWSQALHTTLRIMLANRFPHILWWGPHFIQFYNDAYRPIPGEKHPVRALGRPGSECWSEIWHIIGPLIEMPFNGGEPTWDDDILLEVNRHGFVEETHFTIAYSPVPDETVPSGIGGVLGTIHEITEKVLGERRVVALRDLGAKAMEAKTAEEACAMAALTLGAHTKDIPFALLYLLDEDGQRAWLAGATGITEGGPASPAIINLREESHDQQGWPISEVVRTETMQRVAELARRFGEATPPGPWADAPREAVLVPIRSNIAHQLAGVLVAGISARLEFDELYGDFLKLVASQIATAIANARAYEQERQRAETLAELDRAKTTFFSNVSHEFRTPLTLMLGPVEEMLEKSSSELPPEMNDQLEVVHRNSLRLLKLVNTMLDFSRIEAGRIQARYEAVDLAEYTADLASIFRSAIERAGLQLIVHCPPLPEPVYVDRDMWEKIVLNLLSNAFKFTLEGEIEVRLEASDGWAHLTVRDTGVGIPSEEMGRVFERFHRVQNSRGRTHEGTGIGLALVQELAKLHGGLVHCESKLNEGSSFIVSVPLGKANLDPLQIQPKLEQSSTRTGGEAFVQEALRWLPEIGGDAEQLWIQARRASLESAPGEQQTIEPGVKRARIVWADDNADMREYVSRLLSERFDVEATADGLVALQAVKANPPDLVLSDVMMPRLDGFGLLRELRADPQLRNIPMILLSARAGEEERIEGMEAGVDDYLIKPFSARELLARVDSHIRMAHLRRETENLVRKSEEQLRAFLDNTPTMMGVVELAEDDADVLHVLDNAATERFFGVGPGELAGRWARRDLGVAAATIGLWTMAYREAQRTGQSVRFSYGFEDPQAAGAQQWLDVNVTYVGPGEAGRDRFCYGALDDTNRVRAEAALQQRQTELLERERHLQMALQAAHMMAWTWNPTQNRIQTTSNPADIYGLNLIEYAEQGYALLHPDDRERHQQTVQQAVAKQIPYQSEFRIIRPDTRQIVWLHERAVPVVDAAGRLQQLAGIVIDITERKKAEQLLLELNLTLEQRVEERTAELERSNRELQQFASLASHDLMAPLRGIDTLADFVLEDSAALLPEQSQKHLAMIRSRIKRMEALLNDLLAYSRAGRLRYGVEWLDLAVLIRDTVELLAPPADVMVEIIEPMPAIVSERIPLETIFRNLIINAIKHHNRPAEALICISALEQEEWIEIAVADNGPGIDPSVHKRIFEVFQTLKPRDEVEGSGIGLAMVKKIVEVRGGAIWVESLIGEGTTFRFTWPRQVSRE